jgi:acyl carrier protein
MDDTSVRIRKVLTESMGIDYSGITDDATLTNDLGLDSIELIQFAMELEDEFNIEIDDSQVTANMTVGQVADKIRELQGV